MAHQHGTPALVVVIEGPPRCGKTTMLRRLRDHWNAHERWCATCAVGDEVKKVAHRALGLGVAPDHFERRKDEPCHDFDGHSPRDVYVATSHFMRGMFGGDYFGRLAAVEARRRLVALNASTLLLDAGVEEEVARVLVDLGQPKACVLSVRRSDTDERVRDYRGPINLGLPAVLVSDAVNARIERVAAEILIAAQ